MANEWEEVLVGNVAASISDTHPRDKAKLVFLNTSDVFEGNILHSNYTEVENWPGQAKKSIKQGDILFSEIRPANGRYSYVNQSADDFVVSTKLMVIRANQERIRPKFLYHFLKQPRITGWLQHLAESRSGTFPQITFDQVAELELQLPPLPTQVGIVEFADSIEQRIELNRKMNQKLEATARALFKSWFVDFDPVRAKAEGRDVSLPEYIAVLFSDSFQDSELGEIPTGWTASSIYEIAEFANGAAYRDMHFSQENEGLPVIKIAELKSGVTSTTRFTTTDLGDRYRIETNQILFSWSGNPDTSIDTFIWDGGPAWLNQHIFRVRENGKASRARIFSQLKALRPVFAEIARNKQTTGLGHVTIADMKQMMICEPSNDVAIAFDKYASPLLEQILSNQLQIRSLTALRDILLPKLISGEIRLGQEGKRV